ncbi:GNAT family N-acetyltransferase [Hydrocoleum sp. CS-953]|uniref:GNAT family N-acetyltransferase n=1 Tax=Hydrocoleum sp. CS-953 TaxID=1671698 RepID=UPI000B9AE055|nr:GNAT family N-acetyltransferase [Hydrocoleum sp. CS-953]
MIRQKKMIRQIIESDWGYIAEIEKQAYPSITESTGVRRTNAESIDVLRAKNILSPETCFVFEVDSIVVAFCLSHPYPANSPPSLNSKIDEVIQSSNLFIHDMAVKQTHSGQGIATKLFNHLLSVAVKLNYHSMSLVAVQNAFSFWAKFGFEIVENFSVDSSYDKTSVLMKLENLAEALGYSKLKSSRIYATPIARFTKADN